MTVLFDFLSVPANATRLATLVVLTLFLPLSALTYQLFRRHRKNAKIERMFDLLSVHEQEQQRHLQPRPGSYLCITATYATIVSVLGLTILLFGEQIGLDQSNATDLGRFPVEQAEVTDPARFPVERPEVRGSDQFPMKRSWLMFGMGFLGGYLWGIQYVFRRYVDDDLTPGVYHALAIRMMLAGTVAAVTYNAYAALASEPLIGGTKAWPALAFVLGMFPQRGISWIRDRIPFLSEDDDPFCNGPRLVNPFFELWSCRRNLASVRGRHMAAT